MPDNPKELKEAFRNLYWKFCHDIEMLDELERKKCLTNEERNAENEHF